MIRFLSHKLEKEIPTYGNIKTELEITCLKSISEGDSCHTYRIGMENHWGTHVDCPAHFFVNGKTVTDYPDDYWFFANPQVVLIDARPGQIIDRKDLKESLNNKTDLLLLRSGWENYRKTEKYCLKNPGIAPGLGDWLRKEFPRIRAIGFDWISLSSYMHRELGREAHKRFLNPNGEGHPILIIEDMSLEGDMKNMREVLVIPLRVEQIDSSPCSVVGFFN